MKVFQGVLKFIILISFLCSESRSWNSNSANILEKGRWEMGLFQPFRYGYSEKIEYSTHPLVFFVMPNVSIKKAESDMWGFNSASQFSLTYPTPMLNMLSRKGIGGLIDPNLDIPPMLGLSFAWLMSKSVSGIDLTITNGVDFGLVYGSLDKRVSIDLPLIYHRLGVFSNGWGFHTGLDIQKPLYKNFSILVDLDLLMLPRIADAKSNSDFKYLRGYYSLEHKLLVSWSKSENFRLTTGYKIINAEFPFGNQTRLLPYLPLIEKWVPIIELQWAGFKK